MTQAFLRGRLGFLARTSALVAAMAVAPVVGTISPAEAAIVSRIVVEGNQRVDDETIRAYLLIQPGRNYTAEQVDESLKALFETGLFSDVQISERGGALVVTVQENPIINRIGFEGNSRIKDEQLAQVVESRERSVFTRARVQSDVQRILEVYRRQGRFQASVEPQIIQLPENRVNLVYEIAEGPKTGISRINFIGNRSYSDAKLRQVIETRETGLLSFIRSGDTYDPDRLASDERKLREFYANRGYADFTVVSSLADLDRERNVFFITFTIDEGERYRFGNVRIDSIVPGIDAEALRRVVDTDPGEVYSAKEIEESLEAITLDLAGSGYAFAQVRPRLERHPETRTIDVTYVVDEGPRTYIERINIVGNTRTRDYVIRREFDITEGDAFNRVLIDRAERRLRNLGYFKNVRITTQQGSEPDRVVVNVNVEEQPTGAFSFGAGYSTAEGILGDISITERNFLGRGYIVRGSIGASANTRTYEFGFTDPYFLGRRISAGFNVFRRTTEGDGDVSSYNYASTGGGVTLGFPITEDLGLQVGYQLEHQDIDVPGYDFQADLSENLRADLRDGVRFDCLPYVSRAICEAEGETFISSVLYSVIYDTLDNRAAPREGIYGRFTQQFAGVGGDVRYLRTTAEAAAFHEIYPDAGLVGFVKVQGGYIHGLGEDLRFADLFFKGPDLVRGFEGSGLGPREIVRSKNGQFVLSNDALGGNAFFGATAEVQFPLPVIPEEFGFRGAFFADAGTLWRTDEAIDELTRIDVVPEPGFDEPRIRSSVGASILWASPLGPLRADFAHVISKEDYDETQWFRIGGGTSF